MCITVIPKPSLILLIKNHIKPAIIKSWQQDMDHIHRIPLAKIWLDGGFEK